MIESYISYFHGEEKEELMILELSSKEIEVIAQALHIYICDNDNVDAQKAISSLALQTNLVFSESRHHKVYPNAVLAPSGTRQLGSVHYIPV